MTPAALRAATAHVIVDPAAIDAAPLVVAGDDGHHLSRVLRARAGAPVTVTDGAGRWRAATVVEADRDSVTLEWTGPAHDEPDPPPVEIAVAIPKGDRLDWLVQKVTELGATRLTLLHAERSVVRWAPDRVERQLPRLRRISDEALRQSRQVWRMTIDGPSDARSVLADVAVAEPGGRPMTAEDRRVAVGPEGGWSADELELAGAHVDLGTPILRTETAAVAVVARCVARDR